MKTFDYDPAKKNLLRSAAVLAALCLCMLCLPMQAADALTDSLTRAVYTDEEISLPYRLYVPDDYDPDTAYPLLIFLHGSGGRGDDNEAQLPGGAVWWYMKLGLNADFPCIILAPQCPEERKWVMTDWEKGAYSTDEVEESPEMRAVLAIAAELEASYSIDITRRYITGLSMGGFGTWDAVTRHPDLFAAAVPVCGGGDPSKGALLASSPTAIWTFHCTGDRVVPCSGTTQTVEAIRNAGGDIQCTLYTSNAHDAWTQTYSNADVFAWMFSQKNPSAVPLADGEEPAAAEPAVTAPGKTVGGTTAAAVPRPPVTEEAPPVTDEPEAVTEPAVIVTDEPMPEEIRAESETNDPLPVPSYDSSRANTRPIADGVELGFTLMAACVLLALFFIRLRYGNR